jgi:hypothetical protein
MWCSAMPGQIAGGDFANRPRAESTESTESFQPRFWGEEQIFGERGVRAITPVREPQRLKLSVLSVLSALSAAPLDAQSCAPGRRVVFREGVSV